MFAVKRNSSTNNRRAVRTDATARAMAAISGPRLVSRGDPQRPSLTRHGPPLSRPCNLVRSGLIAD
jgi:hypothetical protein